jgi:hypothetical protein
MFQGETRVNSIKFYPREFPDFYIQIHFESEEVSMEKVVHIFETFKTIFYFKNFEPGKVLFGSNQVWVCLI